MRSFLLMLLALVAPACPVAAQHASFRLFADSAAYFQHKGSYAVALRLAQDAEKQALAEVGEADTAYANTVEKLGVIWMLNADYTSANKWLQKALTLRQTTPSPDSLLYASTISQLGILYKWQGSYAASRVAHQQALRIRERALGHHHPLVASSLFHIAVTHYFEADYPTSLRLYLAALQLQASTLGTHHADYAQTLNNLGSQYAAVGDFAKAQTYYEQAQQIRAQVLGYSHPDYLVGQNNLATAYMNQGEYARAYAVFRALLPVLDRVLGPQHTFSIIALNGFAMLRLTLGNYTEAGQLFDQAVTRADAAFGKQNQFYPVVLSNLAFVHLRQEHYNQAEPLFEAANRLWAGYGRRKPQYALGLNNLAMNCLKQGDTTGVLAMLQEAAQIMTESHAKQNPTYGQILNNMGVVLVKQRSMAPALRLYRQALLALDSTVGPTNPIRLTPLTNIAIGYAGLSDYRRADSVCAYAIRTQQQHVWQNNAGLTETERDKLNEINLGLGSLLLSLHHDAPHLADHRFAYEWVIQTKNLSLRQSERLYRSLERSADTSLTHRLTELRSLRQRLVFQYQKTTGQQRGIEDLERQAAECERGVSLRSPVWNTLLAEQHIDFSRVRAALKPGEAAVEFVHFDYRHLRWTDSTFYVAYVVRPEWAQPKRVFIAEEVQLRRLLLAYPNNRATTPLLYRRIWQPLDVHLAGVRTVFFAPSGLLHRVAFAALGPANGRPLAAHYILHQLNTTRDIVNQPASLRFTPNLRTVILGGVDYGATAPLPTDARSETALPVNLSGMLVSQLAGGPGNRAKPLQYLPFTRIEADTIRQLLSPSPVQLLTGANAREDSLKTVLTSPVHWLHVATHGFWFPYPKGPRPAETDGQPVYRWLENPMLRSGLLLAGAGSSWQGNRASDSENDGILTAYEVAGLNLSATQVVVLSACQTGLGSVANIEGVYGLQRAFKLAGVHYVVASLWPVGDKATMSFMRHFYGNWRSGLPIDLAFRTAQQALRRQNPAPQHWAGFVLVE